ncbi:S41 family peptidase [Salinimicrobium flavum]|uniref:S41 family peptidase n=1 Tax=Salinimicrobium flavum TaxID=1737065 RepID=A0ABW5IZX1_9FLAO
MKKLFLPVFMAGLLFTSCAKDEIDKEVEKVEENPVETENTEVESFIYRGMNNIYLYKSEVPALADDYFSSVAEKNEFLIAANSPEDLFEDLQASHDRFSFMTSDYVALGKLLGSGVAKSNGMDYGLYVFSNAPDNIFGWVRYVLPGTSAEEQGVKRGDLFTEIDGQKLTVDNYRNLLGQDSYSLRIAEISENTISDTDKVVDLVKVEMTEDPIFLSEVLEIEDKKIGYLMYNSFTPSFDSKLNGAFLDLKAQGVTHLILDLRYNSGGNGESAVDLASMITGQFNGKVMTTYVYNDDYQDYYENNAPHVLVSLFNDEIRTGEAINSLGLTEVYVLTTKSSASASEFVINGLNPYIEVIQIGENTSGKYQGSYTLHDSPNFSLTDSNGKFHANPNHTYAIQPLVVKYANSVGTTDFVNGLAPDMKVEEDLNDLGVLGDPSEKLLQAAINAILGNPQEEMSATAKKAMDKFKFIGESKMFRPNYQRLYLDELPPLPIQE